MVPMQLKPADRQMINLLKQDGRISISDLARKLGIARTTTQRRLSRLENSGIIRGYTVKLANDNLAGTFQAYVNLTVDPQFSAGVSTALEKMPEVEALFTVSGKIDFVAMIRVASPGELDRLLDQVGKIPGVRDTRSALVLASKFDRR